MSYFFIDNKLIPQYVYFDAFAFDATQNRAFEKQDEVPAGMEKARPEAVPNGPF